MTAFVRTSIDDGELEMNLNKKGHFSVVSQAWPRPLQKSEMDSF